MWSRALLRAAILISTAQLLVAQDPTSKSFSYQLVEEQPTGTVVADLRRALNPTAGASFIIVRSVPNLNLFSVHPQTGIIRTATIVDRDVICPKASDCVVELDIGLQPVKYFELIKIKVAIEDVNDNPPRFIQPRLVKSLAEGTGPGFVLPLQPADDRDSPSNGITRYELVTKSTAFELKVRQGADGVLEPRMELSESLDRERQAFHQIKVVAYDGGDPPKSGSVVMDVVVEDLNDNAPKFSSPTYAVEVDENASPGKSLLTVRATDLDEGQNGKVVYSFSDRTNLLYGSLFQISPESGEIMIIGELDYEEHSQFVLDVVAQDLGIHPTSSSARVTIKVRDLNDNPPTLTLDPSPPAEWPRVQEHSSAGTFVAQLSVTDPDSGDSGRVHCSLTSPHFELVDIFENEYKVVTSSGEVLDRELSARHALIANCTDLGVPPFWTALAFDVIIDDVNDHAPKFDSEIYNFTVVDGARVSAWVGRVAAFDADENRNAEIVYTLDTDNSAVFVDSKTGVLTSAKKFDRLSIPDGLYFKVFARDSADVPRTATALVNVEIIPEDHFRSPHVIQPLNTFEVSEDAAIMLPIGRLIIPQLASEFVTGDWGFGGGLKLEGNNNADFQVLNATLYTQRRLDREVTPLYVLRLVPLAGGDRRGAVLLPLVEVVVQVTDINDNPPLVLFPSPGRDTVHVPSDAPPGRLITHLLASDPDSGLNGTVSYFLFDYPSNLGTMQLFYLNPETGGIYVNASLAASSGMTLRIPVVVKDLGLPPRSSSPATLKIHVTPPGADRASLAQFMTSSSNQAIVAIVVTMATLLIVVALLVAIVVCRRRKRAWSPQQQQDVTSEAGDASRRSDVTSSTLQSLTASAAAAAGGVEGADLHPGGDLCGCSRGLDDIGYLDVAGLTMLNRPSPLLTPSWRRLGLDETRHAYLTDGGALKPNYMPAPGECHQRDLFTDWLYSEERLKGAFPADSSPHHHPPLLIPPTNSLSPDTFVPRRPLRYEQVGAGGAGSPWRLSASKPLSPPPLGVGGSAGEHGGPGGLGGLGGPGGPGQSPKRSPLYPGMGGSNGGSPAFTYRFNYTNSHVA